jgi:IS5 family transposase
MAYSVSAIWSKVERSLFPALESALEEPLSDALRRVVSALEFVRIEEFVVPASWQMRGRPQCNRGHIARAYIAKAVLDLPTTNDLRELLLRDCSLRRVCGYELRKEVPSKATFSRAFREFAESDLGSRVHDALGDRFVGDRVVMHLCRDATEITARETPLRKPPRPDATGMQDRPKQKCGRKGKNDPPRELTRLEKQRNQTSDEAFADLPVFCDIGVKRDTHGKRRYWVGYKEHIDWADNGFPLLAVITSASVHESQVAIPMAKLTAKKRTVLYEVMDAGYDADQIHEAILELGHRPIIAIHSRRTKGVPFDAATARRYNVRSTAERGNARLKDDFGCRHVRVRGAKKVHQHVMFGILALCADVLVKMAVGST